MRPWPPSRTGWPVWRRANRPHPHPIVVSASSRAFAREDFLSSYLLAQANSFCYNGSAKNRGKGGKRDEPDQMALYFRPAHQDVSGPLAGSSVPEQQPAYVCPEDLRDAGGHAGSIHSLFLSPPQQRDPDAFRSGKGRLSSAGAQSGRPAHLPSLSHPAGPGGPAPESSPCCAGGRSRSWNPFPRRSGRYF